MSQQSATAGDAYQGEITINAAIVDQLHLYPNALDVFREYVCNSWDADATRVDITIQSGLVVFEDNGNGISKG